MMVYLLLVVVFEVIGLYVDLIDLEFRKLECVIWSCFWVILDKYLFFWFVCEFGFSLRFFLVFVNNWFDFI